MAVLLSDESMGALLLSSLHYAIWVGRADEDAAQGRAKLAKHIGGRRRPKRNSARDGQSKPKPTLKRACNILATTNAGVFVQT